MDLLFYAMAVLVFVAAAFTVEALWQWWFSTQSRAARRFSRRLRAMAGGAGGERVSLLKQRKFADLGKADEWLKKRSLAQSLDVHLQQAGSAWNVGHLITYTAFALAAGFLLGLLLLPGVVPALAVGVVAGLLPISVVTRKRRQRLDQMQLQVPEVADLIARSLRAGHALPATLQMVAEEMPVPVSAEFQVVSDEINFGLGLQPALQRLAERVPLDDLRFMVIAILIQRETGGNLAELMGKLAGLIRERLKLLGTVKALSAEGRLSGWILFLLPIAMFFLLSIANPSYISKLLDDPMGQAILASAVVMQLVGGLWMRHIVQLRV